MGFLSDIGSFVGSEIQRSNRQRASESTFERGKQEAIAFDNRYARDFEAFIQSELQWYDDSRISREFSVRIDRSSDDHGFHDFSSFDGLDPSMLEGMVSHLKPLFALEVHLWGKKYLQEENTTVVDVILNLTQWSYFDAFRPIASRWNKHREYYMSHESLESIFTLLVDRWSDDDDWAKGRKQIEETLYGSSAIAAVEECELINWHPSPSKHDIVVNAISEASGVALKPSVQNLVETDESMADKHIRAVDLITSCERDARDFELLKIALIRAAAGEATDAGTLTYNFIRDAVVRLLSTKVVWREQEKLRVGVAIPVDVLIADMHMLYRSGMISEINQLLREQVELYAHANFDAAEQLWNLSAQMRSFEAYEQELIVLECMVANNLRRTEELEARLSFLRSGAAKTIGSMAKKMEIDYTSDEGKIAIDYRTLSWSETQINALFDLESGKGALLTTPLVVAEWNRNIQTPRANWDSKKVFHFIEMCISENFGDDLSVETGEVGTIMDGELDYMDAIVISPAESSRYPWVGFVLSGEQMTRKQASISLFALYYPERDFVEEASTFKRNQKAANRTVMVRERQNPRLNNYISTVESLVIDSLEEYFNGQITEEIY